MNVAASTPTYARNHRVLWRDTGRHVVAHPLGTGRTQTVVLTGGSAVVWRLLTGPRGASDLASEIVSTGQDVTVDEVGSVLADLSASGLVHPTQDAG